MAGITTKLVAMLVTMFHLSSCQSAPDAFIATSSGTAGSGPTVDKECKLENGTVVQGMKTGEVLDLGPGCGQCQCDEDGNANCTAPACPPPTCSDYESPGPYCCDFCPNGNNCLTLTGDMVQEGSYSIEADHNCTCSIDPDNATVAPPVANCVPLPALSTPSSPECLLKNGSKVPEVEVPGDVWKSADGCERCKCRKNGRVACRTKTCETLTCNNPLTLPGRCCPACPQTLKVCVLDSGVILKLNKTVKLDDGTTCSCKEDEDHNIMAVCKPLTPEQVQAIEAKKEKLKAQIKKLQDKLETKGSQLSTEEIDSINERIKKLKKRLGKLG